MKLRDLQAAMVDLQSRLINEGDRVVVIFEGRDTAGKDGVIKRLTEFSHPRHTKVVALAAPTEHETKSWYFQRYVEHLPAAGHMTIFNRSWYNRAGVEPVMGFCTEEQTKQFLVDARRFEHLLVDSGFTLIKIWLDISKEEQYKRLDVRMGDPIKKFKLSELDRVAQERWGSYSERRDIMLKATHTKFAPWTVVASDDKGEAREQVFRYLLNRLGHTPHPLLLNPQIIFSGRQRNKEKLFA